VSTRPPNGSAPSGPPVGGYLRHQPSKQALWWLRPLPVLALIGYSSALAAYFLSPRIYWEQWKEIKVFTSKDLVWSLWAITILSLGIALGNALISRRGETDVGIKTMGAAMEPATLKRVFKVLYRVTLLGYVIWIGVAVHRGVRLSMIFEALARNGPAIFQLKKQLTSVSGVTTIVEVGIAAGIVGSYLLFVHRDTSVRRSMYILVAITFVRSFLNSERLALIEVLVPIVLVWATASWASGRMTQRQRRRLVVLPVILPLVLLMYFGGSEYFRSYSHYSKTQNVGLWQFSLARMEGYYATSYNNGSLLRRYYLPERRLPYFTVEGFWKFPPVALTVPYSHLTGTNPGTALKSIYTQYGNPEYNNPGGLMAPLVDWGPVGGSILLLLVGGAIGAIYGAWRRGLAIGLLVYPFLLDGLLEVPRTFYWTAGRCLPAVAALAWAVYKLRPPREEKTNVTPSPQQVTRRAARTGYVR
jgi:hypothetical protein